MKLPAYRKYKNGRSYFKIISDTRFEEIMKIGDRLILREIHATRLPERNFIQDLMRHYESRADVISEDEYEFIRKRASSFE